MALKLRKLVAKTVQRLPRHTESRSSPGLKWPRDCRCLHHQCEGGTFVLEHCFAISALIFSVSDYHQMHLLVKFNHIKDSDIRLRDACLSRMKSFHMSFCFFGFQYSHVAMYLTFRPAASAEYVITLTIGDMAVAS